MKRPSISVVAAAAGVHRTTASRILRGVAGQRRHSAAAVAAVLAAAERLGWRNASDLEPQIAVVGPGYIADANSAFTELYHDLSAQLTGCRRMLRHLRISQADDWREGDADGIEGGIFTVNVESCWPQLRPAWHLPGVALNWSVPSVEGLDSVHPDDRAGAVELAQLLLDHGHRHLALVMPVDCGHAWSSSARQEGICDTAMAGGTRVENWLLSDDYGRQPIAARLAADDRPTAIVAYSVYQLTALLPILEQRGLRCPDDVSLACCDDHPGFASTPPPITAVHASITGMARAAVDLLLSRIESASPDPHRQVIVPTSVIQRGSIRPLGR